MKKKLIILLSVLILIIGSFGIYVMNQKQPKQVAVYEESVVIKQGSVGKKPITTLTYLIDQYLEDKNIDQNKIAIYIHNFETGDEYILNPNVDFVAASTYKLPLAMYYYEMINQGVYSLSDTITSTSADYEEGGATYNLPVGGSLDIATLLHRSIQDSDNTASRMLFNHLGGWVDYKYKIEKYSNHPLNASFYVRGNVQTVQYLSDCLEYIYNHQTLYTTLLKDMKKAQPNNYLNNEISNITAQKYGLYGYARNSAGIVLEGSPYSIVVLTQLGDKGETVMGEINRICYEYFNSERKWDVTITW